MDKIWSVAHYHKLLLFISLSIWNLYVTSTLKNSLLYGLIWYSIWILPALGLASNLKASSDRLIVPQPFVWHNYNLSIIIFIFTRFWYSTIIYGPNTADLVIVTTRFLVLPYNIIFNIWSFQLYKFFSDFFQYWKKKYH